MGILTDILQMKAPDGRSLPPQPAFCKSAVSLSAAARLRRLGSILWRIAEDGRTAIEDVYSRPAQDAEGGVRAPALGAPDLTISHRGSEAMVIAINIPALVGEARRMDWLVELVRRLGAISLSQSRQLNARAIIEFL